MSNQPEAAAEIRAEMLVFLCFVLLDKRGKYFRVRAQELGLLWWESSSKVFLTIGLAGNINPGLLQLVKTSIMQLTLGSIGEGEEDV